MSQVNAPGTWRINYIKPVPAVSVDYHILDLFDFTAREVSAVKGQGSSTVAYLSAHLENWRPDAHRFTGNDVLRHITDWGNEFYIRPSANIKSIMLDRLKLAVDKGFDGVDVDNVDAHRNGAYKNVVKPGDDGVQFGQDYIQWWIDAAHNLGLKFGLKNTQQDLPAFGKQVDFFVSEDPPTVHDYAPFNKPAVLMNYKGIKVPGPIYNLHFPDPNIIDGGVPIP